MANQINNYITNMMKQYGENWIAILKPEDIQRSTKRIIKEMVQGKYNYEQVGQYFLDGKFLDNLIIATSNELEINTLYSNAVSFFKQYNPNYPNISPALEHVNILCKIYSTVYQRLTMVKQTGNIGYLYDLSGVLYNFRMHLNN